MVRAMPRCIRVLPKNIPGFADREDMQTGRATRAKQA
jgi:hypothetical protein